MGNPPLSEGLLIMRSIAPLSTAERDVISRVVDAAPPVSAGTAAEIRALIAPSDPYVARFRDAIGGAA